MLQESRVPRFWVCTVRILPKTRLFLNYNSITARVCVVSFVLWIAADLLHESLKFLWRCLAGSNRQPTEHSVVVSFGGLFSYKWYSCDSTWPIDGDGGTVMMATEEEVLFDDVYDLCEEIGRWVIGLLIVWIISCLHCWCNSV